jgi:hypothetical protein
MTVEHRILAMVLAAALPGYSWLDGSGWLAWRMFSKSQTYRLTVNVTDAGGVVHAVNPAELARFTTADVAVYLSGSERFRHAPMGRTLRDNLPALAPLACRCVPRAARASMTLEFRDTLDAPTEATTREVRCES